MTRRRPMMAVMASAAATSALALPGCGQSSPHFVPGGGGASVIAITQPGSGARRTRIHSAPFVPDPAALALAATLPLERQVAQLFMVTLQGSDAPTVSELGSIDWGGVVFTASNFVTDGQLSALAGDVVSAARAAGRVPPLIAAVQEGGRIRAFPDLPPASETDIGASGDPTRARAQALAAGKLLRSLGFEMTLAPLADVDTPGGALSGRLFGGDPATVARFTAAAVDGYAATDVIATVSHFPGQGSASADPDQMTATVGGTLDQLRARDLVPFAAITTSAPVIMMSNAAYAAFDGVTPAGLLRPAVQLLRGEYGFQGVVMTDDLDATLQPTGSDPGAVAVQALRAGDDLLYISGPPSEREQAYAGLLAAARSSPSDRALVRQALLHVLSLKARYGVLR